MPVDPLLIFDNGWILEVFGDHYLDPWTLNLPNAVLVWPASGASRARGARLRVDHRNYRGLLALVAPKAPQFPMINFFGPAGLDRWRTPATCPRSRTSARGLTVGVEGGGRDQVAKQK